MTIDCLCPLEIGTLWEIGRDRDWFVLDSQVTTQSVKKWEKTVFPFECFCTCLSLSGFWELLDFSFRYKCKGLPPAQSKTQPITAEMSCDICPGVAAVELCV